MKRGHLVQRLSDGKFLSAHCAAFTIWRSRREDGIRFDAESARNAIDAMFPGCRGSEPKARVVRVDPTLQLAQEMIDVAREIAAIHTTFAVQEKTS